MKNQLLLLLLPFMFSCQQSDSPKAELDLQGHRGARGLMPENSIPAFMEALRLGVTTVEMDIVISKDSQVMVSHDNYLSHEFCLAPDGSEITEADEKSYNLYQMNYHLIRLCDCGSKVHARFPRQKKMNTYKPLLSEVIDSVEAYCKAHGIKDIRYNIETKISPEGDNVFHPTPEVVVRLLTAVLKEKQIWERTTIQSFDDRSLQVLKKDYPKITLSLLVEDSLSIEAHFKKLGFTPDIYSPDFTFVTPELLKYAHDRHVRVIPWSVNTKEDMEKLIALGVDGIISDYPDLFKMVKK